MTTPTTADSSSATEADHRVDLVYDALRDCVSESDDDASFESIRAALADEQGDSVERFDQRYPRAREVFDEAMREKAAGESTPDPSDLLAQLGASTGLDSVSAATHDGTHHRRVFASMDQLEPEALRDDLYDLGARYQMASHRSPDAESVDLRSSIPTWIEARAWVLEALSDPTFDQAKSLNYLESLVGHPGLEPGANGLRTQLLRIQNPVFPTILRVT